MKLGDSLVSGVNQLDGSLRNFMNTYGVTLLRISLGIVFVWFGMLKVIGKSPVEDLVARTVYWIEPDVFIPVLGVWEVVVGLGLMFGLLLRLTLFLFWLQMAGTFLVLLVHPEISFQSANVFLLTVEGEFVVKNLVLITAGIAVGSTVSKQLFVKTGSDTGTAPLHGRS